MRFGGGSIIFTPLNFVSLRRRYKKELSWTFIKSTLEWLNFHEHHDISRLYSTKCIWIILFETVKNQQSYKPNIIKWDWFNPYLILEPVETRLEINKFFQKITYEILGLIFTCFLPKFFGNYKIFKNSVILLSIISTYCAQRDRNPQQL